MKKKLSVLLMLIVTYVNISALGPQEMEFSLIEIKDAHGRTVTFDSYPERIVMAGKSVMLLADAVYMFPDAEEKIKAVGKTDQGLGDFMSVISPVDVTRLSQKAGVEDVLALNPDVVLLKNFMKASLGSALEQTGIPVIYLGLETPEEYFRDLDILGRLLNNTKRSDELIAHLKSDMQELADKVHGFAPVDTLILSHNQKGGNVSFSVSPASWIQSTQVALAGGHPVWASAAGSPGWNQIQMEQIAAWNPETIMIISFRGKSSSIVEDLKGDTLWQNLDAVKNNRLYAFPSDFCSWGQPDSRWILGSRWLASVLHPELNNMDFSKEIINFFSFYYNLDESTIRSEILTKLQGSF